MRPGGAWHHLADGLPSAEIATASQMLAETAPLIPDAERAAFDALRAEVAALDAAEGLPEGLIHPDFVLANVVATPGGCGAARLPRARHAGSRGTRPPRGGRPDPSAHPPRLVGVNGTDNADGGHDSRVADEGPDRDDRDPGPGGRDGPLI